MELEFADPLPLVAITQLIRQTDHGVLTPRVTPGTKIKIVAIEAPDLVDPQGDVNKFKVSLYESVILPGEVAWVSYTIDDEANPRTYSENLRAFMGGQLKLIIDTAAEALTRAYQEAHKRIMGKHAEDVPF